MARPRMIELEQGMVSLQGFPKETADKLSDYIKLFGKDQTIQTEFSKVEHVESNTILMPSIILNGKAIGVHLNNTTNKYEVVTTSFDILTNSAKVDKVEIFEFRRDAVTRFKMLAFELNFS